MAKRPVSHRSAGRPSKPMFLFKCLCLIASSWQRGDSRGSRELSVGRRGQEGEGERRGWAAGWAGRWGWQALQKASLKWALKRVKFSLLNSFARSIGTTISFFYSPLPKLSWFSHPAFLFPLHFLSSSILSFGILCSYHIFPFLRPFSNSPVILSLSASRLLPLPCTMLSFWNYSH